MSDLAIDLGTSHLRVWGAGGELLREPAVVTQYPAPRRWRRAARRLGREALELAAQQGGAIALVRPLRESEICDFKAAEVLLRAAFASGRRALARRRPSVLFAVPPQIPDMQQRALRRLASDCGARSVALVPSSIGVLAGLDVDISAPSGHMVVDIGGGTTQMAVVALSSIIVARSLSLGGDHMDQAIDDFLQRRFNLRAPAATVEEVRIRLGAARRDVDAEPLKIQGRDLISGAERGVEVHAAEIHGAIAPLLDEILNLARAVLAVTPPELASDVADDGIVLSGGASQLRDLDRVLGEATGVSVVRAGDPLAAAARGCARFLGAKAHADEAVIQG